MKKRAITKQYEIEGVPILQDAATICRQLSKDTTIGIDLETTGFSAWRDNIALIQMYGADTGTLGIIQVKDGVVPKPVHDLFCGPKKNFIVHNGVAFDLMFMSTHGLAWDRHSWYDTLVGESLLTPMGRRDVSKSLKASLKRRRGVTIDKNIEHGHWDAPNLTLEQLQYAAGDVLYLPGLMQEHIEMAKKSDEYGALQMEMQLVPYVAQMTINGLPLKRSVLNRFVQQQHEDIADSEKLLRRTFGEINMNSPKQLKNALWRIGLEVEGTGVEVLIPLSQVVTGKQQKIVEAILKYKHGAQRIKMYNEHWMDQHIVADWVHPRFWQCGTDTTRFSSSDPNAQQFPKDSRYIIGNMPGYIIANTDYSQIEIRIAAFYANDEVLIGALEREDIHRAIAAEIYGVSEDQVTADQRRHAKALSFGLLFGGSWSTIFRHAKMSGSAMTEQESMVLTDRFFRRFGGLKQMRNKAFAMAKKDGAVVIRLPNNTRRILVGYNKKPTTILNTIVQGSAAVGIKYGMLDAGRRGLFNYIGAQVHDELVAAIEGNKRHAQQFSRELEEAMITGMRGVMDTTVRVETKMGACWQA